MSIIMGRLIDGRVVGMQNNDRVGSNNTRCFYAYPMYAWDD